MDSNQEKELKLLRKFFSKWCEWDDAVSAEALVLDYNEAEPLYVIMKNSQDAILKLRPQIQRAQQSSKKPKQGKKKK